MDGADELDWRVGIGGMLMAAVAAHVPPRRKPSNYPAVFARRMEGREKRPLGDLFGLTQFGVNLTRLPPGAVTALHHAHSRQDELVYVLAGTPVLCLGTEEVMLRAGMAAGFAAGGAAHHLENRSEEECLLLEIGDRARGDAVTYPDDDLQAGAGADGAWRFLHKDGQPY